MSRIERAAKKAVLQLLQRFPCVVVMGARQVGKTTLLGQLLPQAPFFDLERRSDLQRISQDPDFFLSQYDQPIVIDEAQTLPDLFPALRVAIDRQRDQNGRYLLSGSSSPGLLNQITESLAGRVALFEMGGLSVEEAWGKGADDFYACLQERRYEDLLRLKPFLTQDEVLESCFRGSYPEVVLKSRKDPDYTRLWMENYFDTYIERDIRRLFPDLNLQAYQRFVSMLARSSGEIINASDFARSLGVSQPTVKSYLKIVEGTFLWRSLESYRSSLRKRMVKMPKGYLRDSGLANFLLGNRNRDEMLSSPQVGRIWESFVGEELLKGFKNRLLPVKAFYYRTYNQTEIDYILEGDFGILPIEVKIGTTVDSRSLTVLRQFLKDHRLEAGLVITNSQEACRLAPQIFQIPAAML